MVVQSNSILLYPLQKLHNSWMHSYMHQQYLQQAYISMKLLYQTPQI